MFLSDFAVQENDSAIFNLNRVDNTGIDHCIKVFERYGLFGKRAGLTREQKKEYLISPRKCSRKFQAIMLDVIQSQVLNSKVEELVENIKSSSKHIIMLSSLFF